MATRSTISVVLPDGKVQQSYCHWDGYLEWNGVKLHQFYNSQELAEKLVSMGDISTLQDNLEPKDPSHSFDNPEKNVTVFYARDRGENGVYARKYDNIGMWRLSGESEEFDYIFMDNQWHLHINKRFVPLSNLLK